MEIPKKTAPKKGKGGALHDLILRLTIEVHTTVSMLVSPNMMVVEGRDSVRHKAMRAQHE
jgi:hypothetical protein